MSHPLLMETIWTDKSRADDAERLYQERLAGGSLGTQPVEAKVQTDQPVAKTQNKQVAAKTSSTSSLVDEIARARQQIKNSLQSATNISTPSDNQLQSRVEALEKETRDLRNVVQELQKSLSNLQAIISSEKGSAAPKPVANGDIAKPKPTAPTKSSKEDDDDDIDLFGSEEEEDEDAAKLREKRVAEYAAKKSKKTALIAKSSVILDVKPWDDETDMKELEKQVRSIQMDGLVWGASKLVPLAYGINKFQIVTIVEDDKVSIEELQEKIEGFEDLVQSVDIAAFNKL